MGIDLASLEKGARAHHYKRRLKHLQRRLEKVLAAHIVHGRRAVIMLEGWDAAGKDGIIERLVAPWSQAHYEVWPISAPTAQEQAQDFLWRFRSKLPEPGSIALFDRSWYGRVLVERVEGFAAEEEWRAAYAAINAFEDGLADDGITLVKLFVHVTQAEQDRRLLARIDDPWKRWKTGPDDFRNRARRADYLLAMREMFARTDTPRAPWHAVDGNDKKAARLAALSHVADRLEATVPMDPPALDPNVATLAARDLGWSAS